MESAHRPFSTTSLEMIWPRNNEIIPTALLDTGINLFQASALLTAGDIRLFNHLKEASLTLEEVSQKTNCSLPGLQVLLTCMITLGYINKKENKY